MLITKPFLFIDLCLCFAAQSSCPDGSRVAYERIPGHRLEGFEERVVSAIQSMKISQHFSLSFFVPPFIHSRNLRMGWVGLELEFLYVLPSGFLKS